MARVDERSFVAEPDVLALWDEQSEAWRSDTAPRRHSSAAKVTNAALRHYRRQFHTAMLRLEQAGLAPTQIARCVQASLQYDLATVLPEEALPVLLKKEDGIGPLTAGHFAEARYADALMVVASAVEAGAHFAISALPNL